MIQEADKAWHGVKLNQPDWHNFSHTLAFSTELKREKMLLHLILNAYWEPLDFDLPPVDEGRVDRWLRWIDTSLDSPYDIIDWQLASSVPGYSYRAEAHSVVVLFAKIGSGANPTR